MGASTGKVLYLEFGGNVLDTNYRAFSTTETGGLVDASKGADANRTYLTTLKDGTATATLVIQVNDAAGWLVVVPGTSGTLQWGEEGNSAGSQAHNVFAYVTERRETMAYADLIVADVSWQFTSAVTASVYD